MFNGVRALVLTRYKKLTLSIQLGLGLGGPFGGLITDW